MKVLEIEVHNVKGVKDVKFDLRGHQLFLIGGKNRAGKSSAIDAFTWTLCGKRVIQERPIRDGETYAKTRIVTDGDSELHQSGLIIEREWFADGRTNLTLTNDDGFEAPEPQSILNTLFKVGFDPMEFVRQKPKDQLLTLKQLVGLDFADLDKKRQTLYDQRAVVNKQSKQLEAALADTPVHSDAPDTEVSVADLTTKLGEAHRQNSKIQQSQNKLESLERQNKRKWESVDAVKLQVRRIELEISKLQEQLAKTIELQKERTEDASNDDAALQTEKATVAAMLPVDTSAIESEIAAANETNRKVRWNKSCAVKRQEYDAKRNESASMTLQIEAIDQEKSSSMSTAKWPIDGIGFNDAGVTYNGRPFEQCSSAEAFEVSLAIAMAMNPKLKIIVMRGGSLLDDETIARVDALVREHNYQALIEVTTRNDVDEERCHVILKEGLSSSKSPAQSNISE